VVFEPPTFRLASRRFASRPKSFIIKKILFILSRYPLCCPFSLGVYFRVFKFLGDLILHHK